jgi:hypothetical protein
VAFATAQSEAQYKMTRTLQAQHQSLEAALDWACSQPGWWHDAGNLNPMVLRTIANQAARIGARETAETGCGLSTVLLSAVAETHMCFTVAAGNSLEKVRKVPHLRHERVNFIIGPSQLTVPRHSFMRPLDLVLIDGPHGFPFAHLEYFYFYQKIREGGLLIVDDIHIPTVRQLYDVLRDDKMWIHQEDVLTTAFFQRSEAPLFDPYGDGWERQQFNQRHFSDTALLDIYCPGWRDLMPPAPGPLLGATSDGECPGDRIGRIEANDLLSEEIARLKSENSALRSSASWRVTAPLRALSAAFRRR